MLVCVYLLAIIAANIVIGHFGPIMTPYTAFVLIGLDITVRDSLHEQWYSKRLWLKMTILILSGSIISALFGVGRIAIASFIAFSMAGITDTIAYQLLIKKNRFTKINTSNLFSATVDSITFPTIAFGMFMPQIIFGQLIAKIFGGYIWSLVIPKITKIKKIETFSKFE